MVPVRPPTRWTPTTSSESSNPNRYFRATARAHRAPAITPIAMPPSGLTNAQAGVIATSPATAPDAAPTVVGLPSRICSTSSQPNTPAQVATVVLVKARPAIPSAAPSEPALNPYQPNHSSEAPSSTNGTLCGFIGSLRQPTRLPSTRHTARPAAPALVWTAVPPAKSSALSLLRIQPVPNTQLATGKYTIVTQRATNNVQPQNFARSAIAPEISAGVIIANISWNIANTRTGTPAFKVASVNGAPIL